MASRAFAILVIVCAFAAARAETLKFLGTFEDASNEITFRLTLEATRTNPKDNYSVSGAIKAADGDYKVAGTYYAKSGKLRGTVRRQNALAGKPSFNQPIDGQIQPGGNKLIAKCTLLSPKTKVAMPVTFDAYKVADTKETESNIRAFVLDRVAGSATPDMRVDHLRGTATVKTFPPTGGSVERTIKFTPLPIAFAFGGKWTFTVDAGSIPTDEYCPVKIILNYLDNDPKNNDPGGATITFDLSKGVRSFQKTITWNCSGPNGFQGVSFAHSNAGPYVLYSLKSIKKQEFDRLTAGANAQPAGSSGSRTAGPTTTGDGSAGANVATLRTMSIRGDVTVRTQTATTWEPIKPSTVLDAGTRISVAPESSLTLQLPNGATIEVEGGTEFAIEDLSPTGGQARAIVRINVGALLYRHRQGLDQRMRSDFIVRAAECTTASRGTEFRISYDPKAGMVRLDLRDGKVEFDPGRGLDKMNLEAPTTLTWKLSDGYGANWLGRLRLALDDARPLGPQIQRNSLPCGNYFPRSDSRKGFAVREQMKDTNDSRICSSLSASE